MHLSVLLVVLPLCILITNSRSVSARAASVSHKLEYNGPTENPVYENYNLLRNQAKQLFNDPGQWSDWYRIVQKNLVLANVTLPLHFFKDYLNTEFYASGKTSLECLGCRLVIQILKELIRTGKSFDFIGEIVTDLCLIFKVEKPDVCVGIVRVFKEEVLYVLSNVSNSDESLDYICGFVLGSPCFGFPGPWPEWNVTFPDVPKPPVLPTKLPSSESPKLRVLHLTDIHIDLYYKNGSNADCGKPLCCQDDAAGAEPAGYWGDYRNCDLPLRTIESLFQQLSQTSQFDYILWTGDIPSHFLWNQTRDTQLDQLEILVRLFLKYFPKTPVYPVVGNHESAPVNSFPPPFIKGNLSVAWLYDGFIRSWSHWLPHDTAATISKGGFYTLVVKPGFRIISLNDNYCNRGNWWLLLNSTDPAGELSWLIGVLQNAENHGEKVHIIGHIPPGAAECLRTWSWNYYQIVNRYERVIAGQFFGHKHYDLWQMFYDNDFKRPVSVAYIAPSLTTYVHLNPGYRVYEIDGFYPGSSWTVLDHETFVMNLTQSNYKQKPVWTKEYSAKFAYNMSSLTPKDWDEVTHRLLTDDKAFEKYRQFYYKLNGDDFPACDKICRKQMVCELKSGLSNDIRPCLNLTDSENDSIQAESYFRWAQEKRLC